MATAPSIRQKCVSTARADSDIRDLRRIPRKIDTVIALARRQHRNVTRAQLLALGLSPDAIQRRVQTGRLHREHLGVYSVGTPATTPLELAAAAVLACGDRAVLSRESALALWGQAKRWPKMPRVITRSRIRRPGIQTHETALAPKDIRTHHGIRTTSLARTLLDCAPSMTEKALTRTVNGALRSLYMTKTQLADVCERNPQPPGYEAPQPIRTKPHRPHPLRVRGRLPQALRELRPPQPRGQHDRVRLRRRRPLRPRAVDRRARRLRLPQRSPVVRDRPSTRRRHGRGRLSHGPDHLGSPQTAAPPGGRPTTWDPL